MSGSQTGFQGPMLNPLYGQAQQQGGAAVNGGNVTPTGTNQFQFGALDLSLTPTRSNKERTPSEIPIEKFEYGSVNADFAEWVDRFEVAVRTATNAVGQARLEELFLQWVSLKMNEAARPIFHNCPSRSTNWLKLKTELTEGFEDPDVKRKWARNPQAYMRPKGMNLQVYKAKVLALVRKYSPWVVDQPIAYQMELYTRFLNGLDKACRDYVDEAIAYGKESIELAYNAACKFENKQDKSEDGKFTAGAMLDSEKDNMKRIEIQLQEVNTKVTNIEEDVRKGKDQGKQVYRQGRERHRRDSYDTSRSHSRSRERDQGRPSRRHERKEGYKGEKKYSSPHPSKHYPSKGKSYSKDRSYGKDKSYGKDRYSSGGSTSRSRSRGEDLRAITTGDESDSEMAAMESKVQKWKKEKAKKERAKSSKN